MSGHEQRTVFLAPELFKRPRKALKDENGNCFGECVVSSTTYEYLVVITLSIIESNGDLYKEDQRKSKVARRFMMGQKLRSFSNAG